MTCQATTMLLYQKEGRQRILSRLQVFLSVSQKIFTQTSFVKVTKALATYVAEDGLVGHQWEERFLVLRRVDAPVLMNASGSGWVGEWEGEMG